MPSLPPVPELDVRALKVMPSTVRLAHRPGVGQYGVEVGAVRVNNELSLGDACGRSPK